MLAVTALVALLALAPGPAAPAVATPAVPATAVPMTAATTTAVTTTAVTTTPALPEGVEVVVRVTGPGGAPVARGAVTLADDAGRAVAVLPLAADGTARLRTGALAGAGAVTAAYDGAAAAPSVSAPVALPGDAAELSGVVVRIPAGALTLTTTATTTSGVVRVTDTRAGESGFTLTAAVGHGNGNGRGHADALHAVAAQVEGNALRAADLRVARTTVVRTGVPAVVAVYPAGLGTGTAEVRWRTAGPAAGPVVWTVL